MFEVSFGYTIPSLDKRKEKSKTKLYNCLNVLQHEILRSREDFALAHQHLVFIFMFVCGVHGCAPVCGYTGVYIYGCAEIINCSFIY